LKAHTSSGHKRAVDELLGNPDFRTQLGDVRAADEVRALPHALPHPALSPHFPSRLFSCEPCKLSHDALSDDSFTSLSHTHTIQVRALQAFHDALSSDPDRACYSYAHVNLADEQLAVDTLLVTDRLFKAADVVARGRYVALVERVKDHGGKVRRALPVEGPI
jgi:stalled ribosome rescue protein Dom34